jgi:hypothetical protein
MRRTRRSRRDSREVHQLVAGAFDVPPTGANALFGVLDVPRGHLELGRPKVWPTGQSARVGILERSLYVLSPRGRGLLHHRRGTHIDSHLAASFRACAWVTHPAEGTKKSSPGGVRFKCRIGYDSRGARWVFHRVATGVGAHYAVPHFLVATVEWRPQGRLSSPMIWLPAVPTELGARTWIGVPTRGR